jgi:hypothetical protein
VRVRSLGPSGGGGSGWGFAAVISSAVGWRWRGGETGVWGERSGGWVRRKEREVRVLVFQVAPRACLYLQKWSYIGVVKIEEPRDLTFFLRKIVQTQTLTNTYIHSSL